MDVHVNVGDDNKIDDETDDEIDDKSDDRSGNDAPVENLDDQVGELEDAIARSRRIVLSMYHRGLLGPLAF